ncbi:MAG: DUF2064 domain-containing protein [Dokdonella sp.]
MSGALAIFVKTPSRSALKTRLAATLGREYADTWYGLAAAAVASVVLRACAQQGVTPYWAVAEPNAESSWSGLATIAQGDGGLGERMARVHAQLVARHGYALLIGADAPQLRADALVEAAEWLGSETAGPDANPLPARLVLGPATDGGFWLFGANLVIADEAWTCVKYSQADTALQFQRAMQPFGVWRMLGELTDVDHVEDLHALRWALDELPDPTPEQCALMDWMDANIDAPTILEKDRRGCALRQSRADH